MRVAGSGRTVNEYGEHDVLTSLAQRVDPVRPGVGTTRTGPGPARRRRGGRAATAARGCIVSLLAGLPGIDVRRHGGGLDEKGVTVVTNANRLRGWKAKEMTR
jgi:hypothetical protein